MTESPPPLPHLKPGQWWQCRDDDRVMLIRKGDPKNDAYGHHFATRYITFDGGESWTKDGDDWNFANSSRREDHYAFAGARNASDLMHLRPAPLAVGQWWCHPSDTSVRIYVEKAEDADDNGRAGLSFRVRCYRQDASSVDDHMTHGTRRPGQYETRDGLPGYYFKRNESAGCDILGAPILGPFSSNPTDLSTLSFQEQLAMAFKIDPAKVKDAFADTGTAATATPPQPIPSNATTDVTAPTPNAGASGAAAELMAALAKLGLGGNGLSEPQIRKIIAGELDKLPAKKITISAPNIPDVTVEGQHPRFPELIQYIAINERVFISGPAGSGKTTAVEIAAKTLDRPFFIQPPVADKFELLGFVDAAGHYQATEFYRWATTPGAILLLDEVDGSFPQPLLALNMALANGYAVFPTGKVEIHAENAVVCTANTWGNGADFDYVGRAKLDGAFLNRFSTKMQWDYDEDFEATVCIAKTGATKDQVRVMQKIRANARAHGVKIIITPRDTMAYCRKRAAKIDPTQALNSGVLASVTADARAKLLQNVKVA